MVVVVWLLVITVSFPLPKSLPFVVLGAFLRCAVGARVQEIIPGTIAKDSHLIQSAEAAQTHQTPPVTSEGELLGGVTPTNSHITPILQVSLVLQF